MMKSLMLVSCFVAAVVCQYNNIGQGDRPNVNGQTVPDDTCVLWGDPHFWTFDSTVYSYQDPGWHHIVVSPTVNVQGNFVPGCWTPDPSNACVQGIRIFVLDDNNVVNTMEVYNLNHAQDGYYQVNKNSAFYQILINGKDVGLHSTWNGQTTTTDRIQPGVGINIGSASNAFAYYYTAQGNTLFQIKVQVNTDIVISYIPQVLTITPLNGSRGNSWWKQICGLCGNFNGAAGDDFLVHGTTNNSIALKDENVLRFGNTWAIDYQAAGAPPPVSTDAPIDQQGVFTCNFQPNPTQPPTSPPATQPPTPTRAPPTPAPTPGPTTPGSPTPAPTPSATPAPTPGPTPAPTPSATPRPVPTPSPSATPGPTFPPTQPPTQPPTDTPTPSPTQPSNTTYNYTNVDNSTAVINAKGTPIYDEAVTSCANAGLLQGDPLWVSCMYDVTQTNTTSLAVASAGALVLAGCAKTSLNDSTCVAQTLFACPGACNANGACISGKCQCNKGYEGDTCTKAPLLTAAQLAGVISAGAVAGIAIGAAAFAGLAGFGAKKGYDYYQMRDNKMANVNSNPLYNEKKTGGVSPLYTEKA